jgi:hypothetical protein
MAVASMLANLNRITLRAKCLNSPLDTPVAQLGFIVAVAQNVNIPVTPFVLFVAGDLKAQRCRAILVYFYKASPNISEILRLPQNPYMEASGRDAAQRLNHAPFRRGRLRLDLDGDAWRFSDGTPVAPTF